MKTSHGGREAMFQAKPHQNFNLGCEAMFQAKPHQNFNLGCEAMFQAKPHQNFNLGCEAMFQAKPHQNFNFLHQIVRLISSLIVLSLFSACSSSPKGAYALQTADYGQCRILKEGEKIRYKKRLVKYVCADDKHFLIGKPYQVKGNWYYESAQLNGKKVEKASYTKIKKTFHNSCQLQGTYGKGKEKIQKFYFKASAKRCKPFEWSGKGGFVPFSSRDECEAKCYY